jgi:hypothetical protein
MFSRYYSGHILDPNPPFGLCLTQAIFNHGSDPMFIVASLALIVELLIETRLLSVRVRREYRRVFVSKSVALVRFGLIAEIACCPSILGFRPVCCLGCCGKSNFRHGKGTVLIFCDASWAEVILTLCSTS